MKYRWRGMIRAAALVCFVLSTHGSAQGTMQNDRADGPFARIAILRPHDGDTIDFEAGYIRHLEFHRQAKDTWVWYGWTIWAGERQRWFVYATFGHSASSLDRPVPPADDERDNVSNVTPHAEFVGNALYEYLPALSRGSGHRPPLAPDAGRGGGASLLRHRRAGGGDPARGERAGSDELPLHR